MSTGTPNVGHTITVDTTNETVELQFTDDYQNQTDPPPGASVNWSDPGGAVTFTPDPSNPFKAQVVPVGTPGYAQITAQVVGFNAPDGSPVPNPDPVELGVTPGAAVGERLVVSDSGQVPAPAPATAPDNPQPATPNPNPDPNAPAPAAPTAPDPNAPGTTTPDPSTPTAPAPAPDTPAPAPDPNAPAAPTPAGPPATDPNAPVDPNAPAPVSTDPSSGGSTSPADGGTAPSVTSTDDLQRSVYTFSGDASQVDGNTWPASGYTTGDTGDGNNYPLYYYVGDEAPGQATGNGLEDGAWSFYTGPVSASAA